jgi:hypothetical protein
MTAIGTAQPNRIADRAEHVEFFQLECFNIFGAAVENVARFFLT